MKHSTDTLRRPFRLCTSCRLTIACTLMVVAPLLSPSPAWSQQPSVTSSTPSNAERARISQIVVRYLATWNERDPQRRRRMIADIWAPNGSYVDPNRSGVGQDNIDTMVAQAQRLFPSPYALRLVSTIEAHHGFVRFSWAGGGMPDAPLYLGGTDFLRLTEDGHVQSVVGFADAPAVMSLAP